jgi:hypothetical protein
MRLSWLGAGLLAVMIASGAKADCTGTTILFQDNFESLQPSWGDATDAFKVEAGHLVLSPRADDVLFAANTAGLYDDVDLCATVTTVMGVNPEDAKIGLVFWYVDINNFYSFEIAPNGKASVWRRQRGKWLPQVKWADAPGLIAGDGAVNLLEVKTIGSEAQFFVNNKPFNKIAGSPPENGQGIGIFAASPEAGAARFFVDDLKVIKPVL